MTSLLDLEYDGTKFTHVLFIDVPGAPLTKEETDSLGCAISEFDFSDFLVDGKFMGQLKWKQFSNNLIFVTDCIYSDAVVYALSKEMCCLHAFRILKRHIRLQVQKRVTPKDITVEIIM